MTAESVPELPSKLPLMVPPEHGDIERQRAAVSRLFRAKGEVVGLAEMDSEDLALLLGRVVTQYEAQEENQFQAAKCRRLMPQYVAYLQGETDASIADRVGKAATTITQERSIVTKCFSKAALQMTDVALQQAPAKPKSIRIPTTALFSKPSQTDWRDQAACDKSGLDFIEARADDLKEIREICEGCAVRDDCLRQALRDEEPHGVWGGHTLRERKRMITRERQRASAAAARRAQ